MRIVRLSVLVAALLVGEAHARKFAMPGEQLNMHVCAGGPSAGCRRWLSVLQRFSIAFFSSCQSCPDTCLQL
jgi:hypothetical protein